MMAFHAVYKSMRRIITVFNNGSSCSAPVRHDITESNCGSHNK